MFAASLAKGGNFDNIQPGIDFFGQLKQDGNFIPVGATQATIQSGQTPITIDWDYLQVSAAADAQGQGVNWKVVVPSDGLYANYYSQAISAARRTRPPRGCGRSSCTPTEGQNLFLKGAARPVELAAMQSDGTADAKALPRCRR